MVATSSYINGKRARERRNDLEKWLSPADYSWDPKPVHGTGLWFVQEDMTRSWLDISSPASRLMWLKGIPGSGTLFIFQA